MYRTQVVHSQRQVVTYDERGRCVGFRDARPEELVTRESDVDTLHTAPLGSTRATPPVSDRAITSRAPTVAGEALAARIFPEAHHATPVAADARALVDARRRAYAAALARGLTPSQALAEVSRGGQALEDRIFGGDK